MLNHEISHTIFSEARALMPGGVNSPARAFGAVGGEPIVFDHGEGAYLYDVDGNRYLDFVQSWGPMILGHAHPQVIAAIQSAAVKGTSFGAPTLLENVLAKMIIDTIPSIEKIRFVNSGTEATMSAIRLARGFTGRSKIVKFIGNYHGHVDSLLVAAGSSAATLGVPNSPGVTDGVVKDTFILPYNNVDAIKEAFHNHGKEIAAVIVEPVAGNMGCVVGSSNFLYELRHLTQAHGAVLIFDEVMTGWRVGKSGAGARFSLLPDITTLGKVIGGGLPVGAYGGRADIMNNVLPEGKVFQAGTLSGNPLAMAAGIATLKVLNETDPFAVLERKAAMLAEGLEDAARDAGISVAVEQIGSMMTLFFLPDGESKVDQHRVASTNFNGGIVERSTATSSTGGCYSSKITDWESAARCDTKRYAEFFWRMLERGFYFPCSQFESFFISTAMTEKDVNQTITAAGEIFHSLGKGNSQEGNGR
ncbi:MAG: glutamate-1-semialdehyde 2,1-aminomutase [Planctomycetaceae bacterium]|jgi:glutamate-1-semialdehyde 2,1-aminomutase|nr:glutamate-1-semialdehyde 2,1-aminomutase [Planctomycetaceae bacterium]